MHVHPCLTVESDNDALQTPYMLVVVDGDSERDLIAAEKSALEDFNCSGDGLSFDCGPIAICSNEPASISHGVDRTDAILCA